MLVRMIFVLLCCSALFACSSLRNNDNDDEVVQRKIKTAKINVQLGIAYLEQHNIQRAKQKLILALDQAPYIPETWYSMAYFLEATGDKEQANKYYLKSIQLAPNRGDCQNNYGTFLCRSGEHKKSITHFLAAVKDPDYLDIASAYENAGLCALKIPDNHLATQYFKLALRQDPYRAQSLLKLSDLYYQKGNFRGSKEKLDQFLSISPATRQSVMLSARLEKKLQVLEKHKMGEALEDEVSTRPVRVLAYNEKPLPPPLTTDHPLEAKVKLREKFLKPIQPPVIQTIPVSQAEKKVHPLPPAKQWRGIKKMPNAKKKILVETTQPAVVPRLDRGIQIKKVLKPTKAPQKLAKNTKKTPKVMSQKRVKPAQKLAKQKSKQQPQALHLAKNKKVTKTNIQHRKEA